MRIVVCTFALLLAGCGGGGGGTNTTPVTPVTPPTPPPVPPTPPPTVDITDPALVTSAKAATIIAVAAGSAETLLQAALAILDQTVNLAEAGTTTLLDTCTTSGSVAVSLDDADTSQALSAGDQLTAVFDADCSDVVTDGGVSGELVYRIDDFQGRREGIGLTSGGPIVAGQMTMEPGFTLVPTLPDDTLGTRFAVAGTVALASMSAAERTQAIRMSLSAGDVLTFDLTSGAGVETVQRVTEFDLTRRSYTASEPITGAATRNFITLQITIESELLDGSVRCATSGELVGRFLRGPESGALECVGADQRAVRVRPDPDVTIDPPPLLEWDEQGDGRFVQLSPDATLDWGSFLRGPLFRRLAAVFLGRQVPLPTVPATRVELDNNAVVYDANSDRLFVATDAGVSQINPDDLSVVTSTPMDPAPTVLAISDDGSTLWLAFDGLAELRRLRTDDMTIEEVIELGASSLPIPRVPQNLIVVPGTTDMVVASMELIDELVVYKSGVELPGAFIDGPSRFAFRDAVTLIGVNSAVASLDAFEVTVNDATGLILEQVLPDMVLTRDKSLHIGRNDVFSAGGVVFNETSAQRLGRLGDEGINTRSPDALALDHGRSLVFAAPRLDFAIWLYDEDTRAAVGGYQTSVEPITTSSGRFDAQRTENSLVFSSERSLLTVSADALTPNLPVDQCQRYDASNLITDGEYLSIRCEFSAFTYDRERDLIYAGLNGSAGSKGNAVVIIDAATLTVLQSIEVGATPQRLIVSDDGSTLYAVLRDVSHLTRIDLETLAVEPPLALGFNQAFGSDDSPRLPALVVDAAQQPGRLVVNDTNARLLVFQNDQLAPEIGFFRSPYNGLYFDANDPTALFAPRGGNVDVFTVTATGSAYVSTIEEALPGPRTVRIGNSIYDASGSLLDMASSTTAPACDLSGRANDASAMAATGDGLQLVFVSTSFQGFEITRCTVGDVDSAVTGDLPGITPGFLTLSDVAVRDDDSLLIYTSQEILKVVDD